MKSKYILLVLFIGVIAFIGLASFAKNKQQAQPQKYTVTMSDKDWQVIYNAILTPDDFSVNQRKEVVKLLNSNMAIADTTKPKK